MSWSATYAEVDPGELDSDLDPDHATATPPIAEWGAGPKSQFDAARSAAYDVIEKGAVRGTSLSVSLGGHSEGEGGGGGSNESIYISISERVGT